MRYLLALLMPKLPAGLMTFELVDIAEDPWFAFWIREEEERVRGLDPILPVEMRAGAFPVDNVLAVVIMIRFGGRLYECWLNYYQGGHLYYHILATTDSVVIAFFTPYPSRYFIVGNSLQSFFWDILTKIASYPEWSVEEFIQAVKRVREAYPVEDLWDTLAENVPSADYKKHTG